jgi:hypothetical protein
MARSLPSREEVLLKLDNLCSGEETREQVSTWAVSITNDDKVCLTDESVWEVLEWLGGADLLTPDREYLYGVSDFKAWRAELLGD